MRQTLKQRLKEQAHAGVDACGASSHERVLGVVVLLSDISDTKAYERMKTMFISMVAHEVKAPIAAIQSYMNLIRDGYLDNDLSQIKDAAGRCLDRSGALLTLVQDLLEITRQEAIGERRSLEKIDLPALAARIVEFHRPQAEERGIRIDFSVQGSLKPLPANAGDIERDKLRRSAERSDAAPAAEPAGHRPPDPRNPRNPWLAFVR